MRGTDPMKSTSGSKRRECYKQPKNNPVGRPRGDDSKDSADEERAVESDSSVEHKS